MQILCNENDKEFYLHTSILQNNPLILSFVPFKGSLELKLNIRSTSAIKGLCYHIEHPGLTYISRYEDIPEGTYMAIFQEEMGYVLFFCLSHHDLITTFTKGPSLKLLSGQSKEAHKPRPVLMALRGDSLQEVLQRLFSLALEKTGNIGKVLKEKPPLSTCFGKLGWHSRLAFGNAVSHQKILDAVVSIRKEGFNLGFVIIEEGWQTIGTYEEGPSVLLNFEADPKRFPYGLKGLVEDLHGEGIDEVGIWHGIMGYKEGLHTALAQNYDFLPDPFGRYFPGEDLGRTFQFFYDYYAYLKKQGITFVKVGEQECAPLLCRKETGITHLYKNLQTAIQGASTLHFHSAQLNTDCLRNENLFYWTNSTVAACGRIEPLHHRETAHTIRHHLTHALWVQHLMHPDFDAWPTHHEKSETLAIFHALSGTFTVISDPPGAHNAALLQKCTLPSGTLLKADYPLTLSEESAFVDPICAQKIYKAYTRKGKTAILALFHLADPKKTLAGSFSPQEIPWLKEELFAAFSYRHGFLGLIEKSAVFPLKLKCAQSDCITLAPIENGIGVIGCHLLFLTAAPIVEVNRDADSMHISTSFASPLLLYCERKVLEVRRNGIPIPWNLDFNRHLLSIDPKSPIEEIPTYLTISFE